MASQPIASEFLPGTPRAEGAGRPALKLVDTVREHRQVPAPAERLDLDLPPALLRMMVGAFALFVLLMAAVFMASDGMGIVLAICFVCLAGYFGLPWAIVRAGPTGKRERTLGKLLEHGLELPDGHCGGGEAVGLVLLLPVILVLWAIFMGVMHARMF
jgi:hypothetical protein